MKIEEIQKKLFNTKVYVGNHSKEIQEKLFSFGFHWSTSGYQYENYMFLYINASLELQYGASIDYFFGRKSHRLIDIEDILTINIDPSFKSGDLIIDNEGTLHIYKDGEDTINTFITVYPEIKKFLVKGSDIKKSFAFATDTDKKLFIKILKDAGFIWDFNDKKLYSSVTNKIVNNAYPEDQLAKLLSALLNKGFYWDGESIKEFK